MNTIHNFSASLIQRTKQAGRYSTSGIYTSTVNSFFRFVAHYSLNTFSEIQFYKLSLYISYLQIFSFGLHTHKISRV